MIGSRHIIDQSRQNWLSQAKLKYCWKWCETSKIWSDKPSWDRCRQLHRSGPYTGCIHTPFDNH